MNKFFIVCNIFVGILFLNNILSKMRVENITIQNNSLGYNNCNFQNNGEKDVIRQFITDEDIVFDVGANKGEWSATVCAYHKKAFIYAFEPLFKLQKKLNESLKPMNVKVFCCALSDNCGEFDFFECEQDSALSSFYDRGALQHLSHHIVRVSTKTIDSFCKENSIDHIDFLKIDTEGNEHKVLLGASEMLSSGAIKKIQFEYGGTYLDSKTALKDIFFLLKNYGFNIYRIHTKMLIHVDQWDESLENFNYSNYVAFLSE